MMTGDVIDEDGDDCDVVVAEVLTTVSTYS